MKICKQCKINKNISNFNKNDKAKDGLNYLCRKCSNKNRQDSRRTKKGVVFTIYDSQKQSSKRRGHNLPTYKRDELKIWIFNQSLFHKLYSEWVAKEYDINLKPSVDRLDDSKGYSLDNIQLMTWAENNAKGTELQKQGIINSSIKVKPVLQFDTNNNFIKKYHSMKEASRQTGANRPCISNVCLGKLKTAGGFIWKYA